MKEPKFKVGDIVKVFESMNPRRDFLFYASVKCVGPAHVGGKVIISFDSICGTWDQDACELVVKKKTTTKKTTIKTTTVYLNADKGSMRSLGVLLGISREKLTYFSFSLCELKCTIEVNTETGESTLTHVDGRRLEEQSSITYLEDDPYPELREYKKACRKCLHYIDMGKSKSGKILSGKCPVVGGVDVKQYEFCKEFEEVEK